MYDEGRELLIKLTELQADIQIYLTYCFGIITMTVAVIIGLEQIYFSTDDPIKGFIPLVIFLIAIGGTFSFYTNFKIANDARKEIKELRKQHTYVW